MYDAYEDNCDASHYDPRDGWSDWKTINAPLSVGVQESLTMWIRGLERTQSVGRDTEVELTLTAHGDKYDEEISCE